MNVQDKCPTCNSMKYKQTDSRNRTLYGVIYVLVVGAMAWFGLALNGSPLIYMFIGFLGAFLLFLIRLLLSRLNTNILICLECGEHWRKRT